MTARNGRKGRKSKKAKAQRKYEYGGRKEQAKPHGKGTAITSRDLDEYDRNCRKLFFTHLYSEDEERCNTVYRQCASKIRFHTMDDATTHGKMYTQSAYHCPHCHGYHLTSQAIHGEFSQQREWFVATKEHSESGITDEDIDGQVWMAPFEDMPIGERLEVAAEFGRQTDREMSRRIVCKRGTKTYGMADGEQVAKVA